MLEQRNLLFIREEACLHRRVRNKEVYRGSQTESEEPNDDIPGPYVSVSMQSKDHLALCIHYPPAR